MFDEVHAPEPIKKERNKIDFFQRTPAPADVDLKAPRSTKAITLKPLRTTQQPAPLAAGTLRPGPDAKLQVAELIERHRKTTEAPNTMGLVHSQHVDHGLARNEEASMQYKKEKVKSEIVHREPTFDDGSSIFTTPLKPKYTAPVDEPLELPSLLTSTLLPQHEREQTIERERNGTENVFVPQGQPVENLAFLHETKISKNVEDKPDVLVMGERTEDTSDWELD